MFRISRAFPRPTSSWSKKSTYKAHFDSPQTACRHSVRKHVPDSRSGMCPPINLDAGSPPANPAEIVDRRPMAESENVVRSKTSRGEGLVPRWGRSGAWQNPPCQLAIPNHNSGFSYLGVPAPAGMGDWYEKHVTRHSRMPGCHRPPLRQSRGSGNPDGKAGSNHTQSPATTRSHFNDLMCRQQPEWAIGTKCAYAAVERAR